MKIQGNLDFFSHTLSTNNIHEYYLHVNPIMRVRVSWCQFGEFGAKLVLKST